MTFSNEEIRRRYERLGCVAHVMALNASHRTHKIFGLAVWAEQAIAHEQIEIFFMNGEPVGYFMWALLTPEVADKAFRVGRPIHPSEWNEGELLWVVDASIPAGSLPIYGPKIRARLARISDNFFWAKKRNKDLRIFNKNILTGLSRVIRQVGNPDRNILL
ncbi:toxin-activating lysine-acyltransferase [Caballeronia sp. LZ034LL]|uniref:toxin-activating lysine-acyltransferase n=1 Tax=Caballeronia sp. LZ034LL TaxID=3038567 RepID=UPI00385729A6